jgi:hypothetical protein
MHADGLLPPPFSSVMFFPLVRSPSRSIPAVSAQVVQQRLDRLLAKVEPVLSGTVPWAGQTIQEEVDEFYQAMIAFTHPSLAVNFDYWVSLERGYLHKKLRVYMRDHKRICDDAGITVTSKRRVNEYHVWWSTNDWNPHAKHQHGIESLVWKAFSPIEKVDGARRVHLARFQSIANLSDEAEIDHIDQYIDYQDEN